MSKFTVVNLSDVEDVASERAPGMEGRFARKHMGSKELGVSFFRYGPRVRSPMGHSHKVQEEVYVVVDGSGRVKIDEEIIDVKKWDIVRVSPKAIRAFEGGPEGLALIAIGGTRPKEGDGVPVPDWWQD